MALWTRAFVLSVLLLTCSVHSQLSTLIPINVDENTAPGESFYKFQKPEASHLYSAYDGGDSAALEYFEVSSEGVVSVKTSLTYKATEQNIYDLVVLYRRDGLLYGGTASTLRITVVDVNNHNPVFKKDLYQGHILEGLPPSSSVLGLEDCFALDEDSSGIQDYTITGGNEKNLFKAESVQVDDLKILVIRTTSSLDRDEFGDRPVIELKIQANDKGTPQRFGGTVVQIRILDVNDNPPVFKTPNWMTNFEENVGVATSVMKISATDEDEGMNKEIYYYFKDKVDDFYIDPQTGIVHVAAPLTNNVYNLEVIATDRSPTDPKLSTSKIQLNLIDVPGFPVKKNPAVNSPPKFDKASYNIKIREDLPVGSFVLLPKATDPDGHGSYGTLTFSMSGTGPLDINPKSGVITVKEKLTPQTKYSFTVSVKDGADFTARVPVSISIQPVDKNLPRPVFDTRTVVKTLSVAEDINVGRQVFTAVTQQPTGNARNLEIEYSIASGSGIGWFRIDRNTGIVYTRFRLKDPGTYDLYIEAHYKGMLDPKSTMYAMIKVDTVNRVSPVFSRAMYLGRVGENSAKGSFVTAVFSKFTHPAKKVYYQFLGLEPSGIQLNAETGVITTTQVFDYELIQEMRVEVEASVPGTELKSKTLVNVEIVNLNDNQPTFTRSVVNLKIPENSGYIPSLLCLFATDDDGSEVNRVTYNIESGNEGKVFGIDPETGQLSVKDLDYELMKSYSLKVKASDGMTEHDAYATVNVDVLDTPDPPKFEQSEFTASVAEDSAQSTMVRTLSVKSERDAQHSCEFGFEVTPTILELFSLKTNPRTCVIETRSAPEWTAENPSYKFTVRAVNVDNQNQYSLASVTVNINDNNNHPPVFSQETYAAAIYSNQPKGAPILVVTATDKDNGRNAFITYQLVSSSDSSRFGISEKGEISLQSDVEEGSYSFSLKATDGGDVPKSSITTVTISVLQRGTQKPVFEDKGEIAVSESHPIGRTITTIKASISVGTLDYAVVGGDPEQAFSINPQGDLSLIKGLNYESQKEYELVIRATLASSRPAIVTEKTFKVKVEDANDNAPVFNALSDEVVVYVDQYSPVGTIVSRYRAFDKDSGSNGELRYTVVDGNTQFIADERSGLVTTKIELGRDSPQELKFTLQAMDQGSKPNSKQLKVIVKVRDASQPPKFTSTTYRSRVGDNLKVGTKVIDLPWQYSDINAFLTFQFLSGNDRNTFCVDVTKAVYVHKALDRDTEKVDLFQLQIDMSLGYRNTSSRLLVTPDDDNDNPPVFKDGIGPVTRTMSESQNKGTIIYTAVATDADSGTNEQVVYSIYQVANAQFSTGRFKISPDTGVITLANSLDFEELDMHIITIKAEDKSTKPLFALMELRVKVLDYNDEAPVFSEPVYSAQIPSDAPVQSSVLTVYAADRDSGLNGKVEYEIVNDKYDLFEIDKASGIVFLKKPIALFTGISKFELLAKATDKGERANIGQANIEVMTVTRDGEPKFALPLFNFEVQENSQTGETIGRVTAISLDTLTYTISSGNIDDTFMIRPGTDEIYAFKNLDAEVRTLYTLSILAMDSSERSSTATVKIKVLNENDNSPEFRKAENNLIEAVISRDLAAGEMVVDTGGFDRDVGDSLTYTIEDADARQYFVIRETGVIHSSQSLASLPVITEFNVKASDSGGKSTMVKVRIILANFVSGRGSIQASVEESWTQSTGPILTSLPRTYSSSEYSIVYPMSQPFAIGQTTGYMTLSTSLDYERQTSYHVVVQEQKKGSSEYVNYDLRIGVVDTNDNAPTFTMKSFEGRVNKNAQPGAVVYKLSAVDPDSGSGGKIGFEIVTPNVPFSIDPNTKEIKTSRYGLDEDWYNISVRAFDYGIPQQSSKTATIYIKTGNDPPVFSASLYQFQVPENSPTEYPVGVISARSLSGIRLDYTIVTGDPQSKFTVDSQGRVLLQGQLDFESDAEVFSLRIRASEISAAPLSSEVSVIVQVLNLNDNPPQFTQVEYKSPLIREDAKINSLLLTVSATDCDCGRTCLCAGGILTYSSDDYNDMFRVDPITGQIFNIKPLDYDTQQSYRLQVKVTDSGTSVQTAAADVLIQLKNVNDNAPKFKYDSILVRLSENVKKGTVVATVEAHDDDNDSILYAFENGDSSNFVIDAKTGVVKIANKDDLFFPKQEYKLNISASDGLNKGYFLLHVIIEDINDNSPYFENCKAYRPQVVENAPIGTKVIQVEAKDRDLGRNGEVEYLLKQPARTTDTGSTLKPDDFKIDNTTGWITTTRSFDREKQQSHVIFVIAEDGGHGRQPAERNSVGCQLEITITDANDHNPVFAVDKYDVSISENERIGSVVLEVSAKDEDEGENARISYSIKSASQTPQFGIDPDTGAISVRESLVGQSRLYTFRVEARDHGNTPGKENYGRSDIEVTIKVEKSNPPKFTQSSYSAKIREDAVAGSSVVTVRAESQTGNPKSKIYYWVLPGNLPSTNKPQMFTIDSEKGIIRLAATVDYETLKDYVLEVQAKDSLNEMKSNVRVFISLLDVNDNSPLFTLSKYEFGRVSENKGPGQVVEDVNATDKDSGDFGLITYEKEDSPSARMFNVDPKTGQITTVQTFDREETPTVTFTVKAVDHGTPPLSSNVFVTITITDVNDNKPVFLKDLYEASVKEDVKAGFEIVRVEATDKDTGENAKLSYYIFQGNTNGYFSTKSVYHADGKSIGYVIVGKPLDREDIDKFELTIVASDSIYSTYARVKITVLDANDNNPEFLQSLYNGTISEGASSGILITTVKAIDRDLPSSQKPIRYYIGGQGVGYFVINEATGVIRTGDKGFDREVKSMFFFPVYATDGARTGTANVQVFITDINDERPYFPDAPFIRRVEEGKPPGTKVGPPVTARDRDDPNAGGNAKLTYSLVTDANGRFKIDSLTGQIQTLVILDREVQPNKFVVVVRAQDGGIPMKHNETSVTIIVTDANDQKPQFKQKQFVGTVKECAEIGYKVTRVEAFDLDEGVNALLSYYIVDGPSPRKFRVDADDGSITVAYRLDYEEQRSYQLKVNVRDKGQPPLTADESATVDITIEDCNDSPPLFKPASYLASVYENVTVGQTILRVSASDSDSGDNGMFSFGIFNPDDNYHFGIKQSADDPKIGYVYILYPLDRETLETHTIKVTATDKGDPPLTGYAQVTIKVLDVNDNGPIFEPPDFCGQVKEATTGVQKVTTVTVRDPDGPSNSCPCFFSIVSGSDGIFQIDRNTGVVTTTPSSIFDRERTSLYTVRVSATDSGQPPQTSYTNVFVEVADINDNVAKDGGKQTILLNSYMGKFIGGAVGSVFINDDDLGTNDKYSHTILSQSPGNWFSINANDGQVVAKPDLPSGVYTIQVSSTELNRNVGGPAQTVSSTVEVKVREVSEKSAKSSLAIRMTGISKKYSCKDLDYPDISAVLAKVLGVPQEDVVVFSVQSVPDLYRGVDIRFSVKKRRPGFEADETEYMQRLDMIPLVSAGKEAIEAATGGKVHGVGIDPCAKETCRVGFCYNQIQPQRTFSVISNDTGLVNSQFSKTFVSIDVLVVPFCSAQPIKPKGCEEQPCLHGGRCVPIAIGGYHCVCPRGYDGPQCQVTTRSFLSLEAYVWLKPLNYFYEGTLSFEFSTTQLDALLLYQGPVVEVGRTETKDFLAVELVGGKIRVSLTQGDFRIFTMTLTTGKLLNDNLFHIVTIYKRGKYIQVTIDDCRDAEIIESYGKPSLQNRESCEISGTMPGGYRFINGLNPLQLGGIKYKDRLKYPKLEFNSFIGCIRKVTDNGIMYDLGAVIEHRDTEIGCRALDNQCPSCYQGLCDETSRPFKCICYFGWIGPQCDKRAPANHYLADSYTKYTLVADRKRRQTWKQKYMTLYQIQVRTKTDGILIYESSAARDKQSTELSILEIKGKVLTYSFNVGDGLMTLRLPHVNITDGEFRNVTVHRVGNRATLDVMFEGSATGTVGTHRLLDSDGIVYAGGLPDNLVNRQRRGVTGDMQGCLADTRYGGENADSSLSIKVERINVEPTCPCLFLKCLNGGICMAGSPPYCVCPAGYSGPTCGIIITQPKSGQIVGMNSEAYVIICVVLLIFLLSLLLIGLLMSGAFAKKRAIPIYIDDDMRDNIMPYQDEGAGEDDFHNYDMEKLLQYAGRRRDTSAGAGMGGVAMLVNESGIGKVEQQPLLAEADGAGMGGGGGGGGGASAEGAAAGFIAAERTSIRRVIPPEQVNSVEVFRFIECRLEEANGEDAAYPRDTLLHYGYEGEGSDVDDLSELGDSESESEDEDADFAFLNEWGQKFDNLNKIFNPASEEPDEDV